MTASPQRRFHTRSLSFWNDKQLRFMIVVEMAEAVIFDWDGTLADTKKAVVQSFQKVLGEAGCRVSDEFIERRIGIGTKKTFIEAFRECHMRLDVSTLERLAQEKVRIQVGLVDIVNLFDGVTELLEALQGRVMIALATMSGRKVVDKLLPEKRVAGYFDVVVTADEVVKPKPDPEVFLVSAAKLGVKPEDCVVVEDSVFGVRAAKAAGMMCIAVSSGVYGREELEEEKPDLTIGSLVEKDRVLSFIFGSV
ncbi:MAG TPA: HAD family phosphatase [Candidatus Bathyarchaeota archaeon]|nr:HAD family phosphatase [Candidatus Bathyarchaeota archaeon]